MELEEEGMRKDGILIKAAGWTVVEYPFEGVEKGPMPLVI